MAPIFSEKKDENSGVEKKAPQQKLPPKPVVAKKVTRRTKKEDAPLIKDALEGRFKEQKISAKEQHDIYNREGDEEEFTEVDLKLKWNEFLVRLESRPNLKATLTEVPKLEDNFQLVLDIENSVQDDLISSIKPELVSFLRKELKNSKIQLITQISENIKTKIIYTDNDRYDELLKKNPDLALLKRKFKLDF